MKCVEMSFFAAQGVGVMNSEKIRLDGWEQGAEKKTHPGGFLS